MARIIRKSVGRHNIENLTSEQRDLFKKPVTAKELAGFDAAIINPPRVGAKEQTKELAASGVSTIAMISCNPATFTRDAKMLKEAGFSLASVRGLDQFVWSPHLEIAAVFKR
jgi:23S rRNA (uracil1939-C5)-methyltransferase